MTTPADPHDHADPAAVVPDPTALRLRETLRVEILDGEALVLDPAEGVVHRLEGAAARIVADLRAGRVPADAREHEVIAALVEARIVAG